MTIEIVGAHTASGTNYSADGARAYAASKHGPDGAKFLDPYFQSQLLQLAGKKIADVGTGAAPWAIFAAQNGAEVWGVDIQEGMLNQAVAGVVRESVGKKIFLQQADGAALPYPSHSFDLALSINVGCNLPSTSLHVSEAFPYEKPRLVGFYPYFEEMARILKPGGKAVITAPTSFGEVFTAGIRHKNSVRHDIHGVLKEINSPKKKIDGKIPDKVVVENLNTLLDVHRATFAYRNGNLTLVTDEADLVPGENIWRKLPGITVPNRYHSRSEYTDTFRKLGLCVVEESAVHFGNQRDRIDYNVEQSNPLKKLGPEYINNPPFTVWIVQKP